MRGGVVGAAWLLVYAKVSMVELSWSESMVPDCLTVWVRTSLFLQATMDKAGVSAKGMSNYLLCRTSEKPQDQQ